MFEDFILGLPQWFQHLVFWGMVVALVWLLYAEVKEAISRRKKAVSRRKASAIDSGSKSAEKPKEKPTEKPRVERIIDNDDLSVLFKFGAFFLLIIIVSLFREEEPEEPAWVHLSLPAAEQLMIEGKCERKSLETFSGGKLGVARKREKYFGACLQEHGFVQGREEHQSTENWHDSLPPSF